MLENKFKRLALLMEPDVARMLEKQAQRAHGHDEMRWDERAGVVTYLRNGAVLWQPRADKIGVWFDELGLFRWWWTGTKLHEAPRTRLDRAYREGEHYGLPELVTDPLQLLSEGEADHVARLTAQLARADGMARIASGTEIVYLALWDTRGESTRPLSEASSLRDTAINSPSIRPSWLTSDPLDQPTDRPAHFMPAAVGAAKSYSVAPPSRFDAGARSAYGTRSIPPVRALDLSPLDDDAPAPIPPPPRMPDAPRDTAIRDPARELFMPVAQAALADIAASLGEFRQALLVLRVEASTATSKGRFFVQLVAADDAGELQALDPSRALLDAAAKMIADDARDGNGRWKKLVARLRPTARGASVDVVVT